MIQSINHLIKLRKVYNMNAYCLHWNGLVYAMTIYGSSKKDAINRFKTENYIKRMPNGWIVWKAY